MQQSHPLPTTERSSSSSRAANDAERFPAGRFDPSGSSGWLTEVLALVIAIPVGGYLVITPSVAASLAAVLFGGAALLASPILALVVWIRFVGALGRATRPSPRSPWASVRGFLTRAVLQRLPR